MIAGFLARVRSLWHNVRRRSDIDAEVIEEFRHHLALRTEDLIREGHPPDQAARQARVEFGHIESLRQDARASRGLRFLDGVGNSWLDVKLGLRMLRKYPGLSLTAVFGMSVAIAISAGSFGFIDAMLDPSLPLDEGDRVVSLHNADLRNPGNPDRQSLHDFVMWRDELTSITNLGAFTSDRRNLVIPGRDVALVGIAQITASGFEVARTQPVLGRPLLEEDERNDAPPVVVIAYEEWQRRFDADPDIIGRSVTLGNQTHTVVGVMPEGFRFPINHRYWVPLTVNASDYERGRGPSLIMFGRLAERRSTRGALSAGEVGRATFDDAQAELTAIGLRTAAMFPETNGHLRPRLLPYTHDYVDIDSPAMAWALRGIQFSVSLLLVVVAVNVAILVYARTATRAGEIAIRTALGASRKRVVAQLFVEALILSGIAAMIGVLMASAGLDTTQSLLEESGAVMPFWIDFSLSPALAFYVLGLAILGGVIVGVFPALKATGRRVQAGLQQLSSHGCQLQLGRLWTVLIVAQVAVAVTILPFAMSFADKAVRQGTSKPGFAAEEFLRGWLSMEREEAPADAEVAEYERAFKARYLARATELMRRLNSNPVVAGVTFAAGFPGEGTRNRIELEGVPAQAGIQRPPARPRSDEAWAGMNQVDARLFDVIDIPVLAGRGFVEADAREGSNAVIVDRRFAEDFLGGGDVVGRHVRVVPRPRDGESQNVKREPWLEIVGVVPDFTIAFDRPAPNLYRPVSLPQLSTVINLTIRVRTTPASTFAGQLRDITAAVDPGLQLHELEGIADAHDIRQQNLRYLGLGIVAVTVSVLLLSAAGIYAMMSFTVARRRREIGIRTALGAGRRQILGSIFARACAQLGTGVLLGLVLAAAADQGVGISNVALLPVVALLMMLIGVLAALGPARRGLAIQPTEALRDD